MASDLEPLGEYVRLLSGNTPSKANADYWGGNTPWISAKDMGEFWLEDSIDHLTPSGVAAASRVVPAGTVLMLTRGMMLHNRIPICRLAKDAAFNQDVKAVIPKNGLNVRFLPYLLTGNHDRLHERVDAAGHGTGRLNTDAILSLPVHVPSAKQQIEIALLGEAIDRRIHNLRSENLTLEAIAQTLFKSWFVNFDPVRAKADGREPEGMDAATAALFPGEFENSELGPIPKGWTLTEVGAVAELIKGCSYKGAGLSESEGAFMFNLGCFSAIRTFATVNIKRYTGIYRDRHVVRGGDLIMANTDMTQHRQILGRALFVPAGYDPAFVSHHVFKVVVSRPGADVWKRYLFFVFQQSAFRERAVGHATGTTVLALARDSAELCPVIEPSTRVLASFDGAVAPLLRKMERNLNLVTTLEQLRDTLLPRLISGKLRLPEAERAIEAATA